MNKWEVSINGQQDNNLLAAICSDPSFIYQDSFIQTHFKTMQQTILDLTHMIKIVDSK